MMQYSDEKREKLERLQKKLYSRNGPDIIDKGSSEFAQTKEDLLNAPKTEWDEVKSGRFDELAAKMSKVSQNKHKFVGRIFTASLIFFVVAAGVAAFVFLGGGNLVSSRNVDIKVFGPLSVPGGQEISVDVNILNNNNVDLNSASLLVEYPEGVRSPSDFSKELDRERFELGTIKSGEGHRQSLDLVFFGEKDSVKIIQISLEYRVENSSALFYKEKAHEILISSAPIILTPTYPKEVNSNQEINFDLEVASNSKDKLDAFLVKVEYPFGFIFESASPQPAFGDNVWKFENFNPGAKRTISIRGRVVGQNNEEKIFRISAGSQSDDDEREIAVPLSELTEAVMVKKPFLGLDIFIKGQNGDANISEGDIANAELIIRNNLPSKLFNAVVEVEFGGAAFDRYSVFPSNGGFFQSANNTILWDKRSVAGFSEMNPGSETRLNFRFSPLSYSKISSGANPEIELKIRVRGERVTETGSVEEVVANESRKAVLATNVSLSSKLVRSLGNIENSGPIPQRADRPTTYTVVWSISNSFNQVSNVEVRASLPSYVKWGGLYNPSGESISFNSVTNEVVWDAGSVLSNTGFGSAQRQVYFQIEFLPSVNQIGEAPMLLGNAKLSGIDKITGLKVESTSSLLTTNFSLDPTFREGDDKVRQ